MPSAWAFMLAMVVGVLAGERAARFERSTSPTAASRPVRAV
jgi:hypothetical protein